MKKSLNEILLCVGPILLTCGAMISCGSLRVVDFDSVLSKTIGQHLDQIGPPGLLDHMVSSRREGDVLVNEYGIYRGGKCRWQLFINAGSGTVTGWRYTDEFAKAACHDLPVFRGE